jgi:hypothetical protein
MATPVKDSTPKWALTQFLPILAIILVIVMFPAGLYVFDEIREDVEEISEYATETRKLTQGFEGTEDIEEALEKQAKEMAAQLQKNANFLQRIETLENKPTPQPNNVLTLTEKSSILNEINLLKSKMSQVEGDIDDLEDDNRSSSSSSSSSSRNNDIEQDTTIDDPSNFYDRNERITFSGRADSNADIELFVSYDGDRFIKVGDDKTNQSGIWVISCIDDCSDRRGDYEVYAINTDNDDKSRTKDYRVD